MPNRSLALVPRVEQSAVAQTVGKKPPARATAAFTPQVEAEIVRRWTWGGQSTREISRGLRLGNREAVEAVVQRRMGGRGPVLPPRRVA